LINVHSKTGPHHNFAKRQFPVQKLTPGTGAQSIAEKEPNMPRPRKPPYLRLLDGSHRSDRHGSAAAALEAARAKAKAFGPLVRPPYFKGHQAQAWDDYVAPAWWLDRSREMLAIVVCELWAEFRTNPRKFNSARHSQLRGYLGALGLTDERFRAPPPAFDDDENYA
jgi:hypothetical protein